MASTSDGMGSKKGGLRKSGMKLPSLIKLLQDILSSYPDGGQILKELIQNAEDAGARRVKILYDGRRINQDNGQSTELTKFFKGPAICVYNDAEFTDKDWEGIQMIYSSVKEEDKLKVGRFGLGFKSVFHITDTPSIISGDQMLFIDPHQPRDDVITTMDISEISNEEFVPADTVMEALDGCFDFSKQTLTDGHFPGTILRFPLREKKSELSENLYSERRVTDLFEGFQTEISTLLLFLKNLESIAVYRRMNDITEEIVKACIIDKDGTIREKRDWFSNKLKESVESDEVVEDIESCATMTIKTQTPGTETVTSWQVVNYVMGKTASDEFQTLMNDQKLGYSPCVAIALCQDVNTNTEGHVFCFLPLPKEGAKLSGLPFHVNGFFALSKDRHHLKWATDEQKGKDINDKAILWNEKMIMEALPRAYEILLESLINAAVGTGNVESAVKKLYQSFIDINTILDDKWKCFAYVALKKVSEVPMLFCHRSKTWVTFTEAVFAFFDNDQSQMKSSVEDCLDKINRMYVDIQEDRYKALESYHHNLTKVTPSILSGYLKQNTNYTNLSNSVKLDILSYILSDSNPSNIDNLELLPLANGQWTKYSKSAQPIYVCSEEELELFPGLHEIFVEVDSRLERELVQILDPIISKGTHQLQRMTQDVIAQLLRQVLSSLLPDRVMTNQTQIGLKWLKYVWLKLIQGNDVSSDFCDLPLLPRLIEGSYNSCYRAELVSLSSNFLLLQDDGTHVVNKSTCDCLEVLNVQIIPKLPDWLPLTKIRSFVSTGSYDDICGLLDRLVLSTNHTILQTTFNRDVPRLNVPNFVDFLSRHQTNLKQNVWNFVAGLRVFTSIESSSESIRTSSVQENKYFIDKTKLSQFPDGVKLPYRCLKIESRHCTLVECMGGCELTVDEFMEKVLERHTHTNYNDETGKLLCFFLTNFTSFNKAKFIDKAKNIRFLWNGSSYCRPNELFDSSDKDLADLFMGMNVFPLPYSYIKSLDFSRLRQLGLKTLNNLQSQDIINIAKKLDLWSRQRQVDEHNIERNAKALMRLLENNSKFLQSYCGLNTVGACLKNLSWVHVKALDEKHYPVCLPSYRHTMQLCKPSDLCNENWTQVVGSSMPIVEASESLTTCFGWNSQPPTSKVVEQLQCIRRSCSAVEYRPDILPLLRSIYSHMAERQSEFLQFHSTVADEHLIWSDDGFMTPANVVINHDERSDLNLRPYISYIPQEFQRWASLFEALGCNLKQSFEVLVNTLKTIRDKYEQGLSDVSNADIDRKIVVNILVRLTEIKKASPDFDTGKVLMLIHYDDNTKVKFAALHECVYDDDEEFLESNDENDCSRKYVHPDVRLDVAKCLGVQSLTKRSLLDTEDVELEEWGQVENLTSRLHTLLHEGYTDGLSVLKEMIQNADDAGASTVKLLYDERMNRDARRRLFSPSLGDFQGPALWVYNDAMFTTDDLTNITKLNGATKKGKKTTIGKFGLGFCSVYNLTDIPSFVSGNHLVLFDPHESHIEDAKSGTGLKVKLSNRTLVKRHIDQFKPFEDIFGCKVIDGNFEDFRGTLFRLPLRTAVQADRSKISNKVYNSEETRSLLKMFVRAAGNTLLFSQNVVNIEIHHLADDLNPSSDIVKWFSIKKSCLNIHNDFIPATECKVLEKASREVNGLSVSHIVKLDVMFYHAANQILNEGKLSTEDTVHWLVSWAMPNVTQQKLRTGAFPLAAIASPLDNDHLSPVQLQQLDSDICYTRGHLFCFMPLPLTTDLHFHINGCFEVRSDRRELMTSNEDDIISNKSSWNDLVMGTTTVKAFVDHLLYISQKEHLPESYSYDLLWPKTVDQHTTLFVQEFYRHILSQYPAVFKGHQKFVSFEDTLFLDPDIDADIRTIGTEMIIIIPMEEGKQIVTVDRDTLALMNKYNPSKGELIKSATISLQQLLTHFLQNITHPFFKENIDNRNVLLRSALTCNNAVVNKMLQSLKCIPTEPAGFLEMICCLVHPDGHISNMFSVEDGRFPSKQLINSSTQVLNSLARLGMNENFLTDDLLIDRTQSIEVKSRSCSVCTLDQIKHLMKYLGNRDVMATLDEKADVLSQLRLCYFLPVKQRPSDWTITWRGDIDSPQIKRGVHNHCQKHQQERSIDVCLAQPTTLFRTDCMFYIGSNEYILGEDYMNTYAFGFAFGSIIQKLKVRTKTLVTLEMILVQLETVSDELNMALGQTFGQQICSKIYENLHHCMKYLPQEDVDSVIENHQSVLSKPIILIGEILVRTTQVIVTLDIECQPDFYRLPSLYTSYISTFMKLGVKDCLSTSVVIDTLDQKKSNRSLDAEEITNIGNLLRNLRSSMQKDNCQFSELGGDKTRVIAPDSNGVLVETQKLSLNDRDFETKSNVRLLHGNCVTIDVAKAVGVRSKKEGVIRLFSKMMPFGQKEELSTRLNGLLKDYPCDESIMKELIQNADDAGATEICFIKHFEKRLLKRPFGSEKYQGPALCIYNNSHFTEADFEGIQNLGIGSKSEDPLKTGQYGIGFNAVYHLTDVPSFLSKAPGQTGGDLCIFDPLLISIAEHISEQSPGLRCDVNEMTNDFKDFLEGYNMVKSDQYTLFRLPLRSGPSKISRICMTAMQLESILLKFSKEMQDCLHFLRNITCIRVMTYEDGQLKEDFSVSSKMSKENEAKRRAFFDQVTKVTKEVGQEKEKLLEIDPFDVTYTMTIDDIYDRKTDWLVVNRFGLNKNSVNERKQQVVEAFKQKKLGLLPYAGISTKMRHDIVKPEKNPITPGFVNKKERPASGTVFCFLPLPVYNGLPFHVNGHFAVDRSRRGLLTDGTRKLWNELLLTDIATDAIYHMLVFMQSHLIQENIEWYKAKEALEIYDLMFPILESTYCEFWQLAVTCFYSTAFQKSFAIFPHVTLQDKPAVFAKVGWTRLAKDETDFDGGICDNVTPKEVIHFLKAAKLKIVYTSTAVKTSITNTKAFTLVYSSPKFVIGVLKSDRIIASGVLQNTTFAKLHIFQEVLSYIKQSEVFNKEIRKLPLNLGNDGMLRRFHESEAVICSKWCELLPGSLSLFLHKNIVNILCFETELFKDGVLRKLTVSDVVSLLTETLDPELFRSGSELIWRKHEMSPFAVDFLCNFYRFIYEESIPESSPSTSHIVHKLFQENLKAFEDWSLLPSRRQGQASVDHVLIPIKEAHSLLVKSGGNEATFQILEKMNIPTLDHDVFSMAPKLSTPHSDVRFVRQMSQTVYVSDYLLPRTKFDLGSVNYALLKVMASTDKPDILLKCLDSHRNRICNVNSDEASDILSYFNRNLKLLAETIPCVYKDMLKSLPLYKLISGELQSIEGRQCSELPGNIPNDGLQVVLPTLQRTYLNNNFALHQLFVELGVVRLSELEFYANVLMPSFQQIPQNAWMAHISHIKSYLMIVQFGEDLNNSQKRIVYTLKDVPFIRSNEGMKYAREFYDENNPVFACMLTSDKFLPVTLKSWKSFLVHLGFNSKPTGRMVLDFAKRIAGEATQSEQLSNVLCKKSETIISYILSDWEKFGLDVLTEIRTVKFVFPYKVGQIKMAMCRPYVQHNQLMCFNESVRYTWEDVCWTSVCLLKESSMPLEKPLKQALGIYKKPRVLDVIKHTHNITDSIQNRIRESGHVSNEQESIMDMIYRFLQDSNEFENESHKLQNTPFVLIPPINIVPARDTVLGVLAEEIPPYLYKIPNKYKKFSDIFGAIGAEEEVKSTHYFAVLKKLFDEFKDQPLPMNKMECVQKALRGLFKTLKAELERNHSIDHNKILQSSILYLPDDNFHMKPANSLIVSDNDTFEEILRKSQFDIAWFVGIRNLDPKMFESNQEYIEVLRKIPSHTRPLILTDIVENRISMEYLVENSSSREALKWENFLRSAEFIEGIVRVLRQKCRSNTKKVIIMFSNVCIREVSGLYTFTWFRDTKLEHSGMPKSCFITTSTTDDDITHLLYFQPNGDNVSDVLRDDDGIYTLIELCTEGKYLKHNLVEKVLSCIDRPSEIRRLLDLARIEPFSIENTQLRTLFPSPGTYVESRYFPFVVQSILPFKEHEYRYLALDVSGDDDEDDEAYIYVHILKEMPRTGASDISIRYWVDVGERGLGEPVIVPIFQLYRFVPQTENTGTEIQLFDNELTGSLPFDENCKRVREMLIDAWALEEKSRKKIIRRLLLRWHPDKNKGHEEYATRVFNYIKEIIVKLERNEPIDGMLNRNTGRSSPNMSGSRYEHFSNRCGEQARAHQRAYSANYNSYCRSTRSGQYAHHQTNEKVCRPSEAKRWLQQAKYDFSTAKAAVDGADKTKGYNWICYNCHQSCEKALKAVWFFTDANSCPNKSHDLSQIARGLGNDTLQTEVTHFETQTVTHGSQYFRLRYPDSMMSSSLPADVYTTDQARDAIEITKKILKLVDDMIN